MLKEHLKIYQLILKFFNNQLRSFTEELTSGSVSTQNTTVGPFKEGQTIIVNGVQIVLGKSVNDAGLVGANETLDGDSFLILEKNNTIKLVIKSVVVMLLAILVM